MISASLVLERDLSDNAAGPIVCCGPVAQADRVLDSVSLNLVHHDDWKPS